MEKENIMLSIILCSRNDDYGGNAVTRLEATLNHTGKIFASHNLLNSIEVILTDWGSIVPLEKILKLNNEIMSVIKINYIKQEITSKFPTKFSEVHALNSAAKLANGAFIARIDQDTLIGDKFINWFFDKNISNSSCSYFSNRRDMDEIQSAECLKNTLDYIKLNVTKVNLSSTSINENNYWREAVGIFLIPRNIYYEIRGYDEKNIFTNHMEHEFCTRLNKKCGLVQLGPIVNYDFLHIFHKRTDNKKRKKNIYLSDRELSKLDVIANNENWGTCNYNGLMIFLYRTRKISFKFFKNIPNLFFRVVRKLKKIFNF